MCREPDQCGDGAGASDNTHLLLLSIGHVTLYSHFGFESRFGGDAEADLRVESALAMFAKAVLS